MRDRRHCRDTTLASRIVLWTLSAGFCYILVSASVLSYLGRSVPEKYHEWGGLIIMALTALLGKSAPDGPTGSQDVNVVNPPGEPVPTTEEPKDKP